VGLKYGGDGRDRKVGSTTTKTKKKIKKKLKEQKKKEKKNQNHFFHRCF
jgi:hypothetical protein